jgi:glutathione S-transferase
MFDSPYVRRAAISARMLGLEFEHRPLSIFAGYDEFRSFNPMVKVPTLVCDNGEMLVDSTLIIDYLERLVGKSLMPDSADARQIALRNIGIALVAMEKVVQLIYERGHRPKELRFEAWTKRLREQLASAVSFMEQHVGDGESWMLADQVTQADVTTAVAWRFVQHVFPRIINKDDYPGLVRFSDRAEALPDFLACPL